MGVRHLVVPWDAVELEMAHVGRVDLQGWGLSRACITKRIKKKDPHRLKVILPALRIDQVKVGHGFELQDGGMTKESDKRNTRWEATVETEGGLKRCTGSTRATTIVGVHLSII